MGKTKELPQKHLTGLPKKTIQETPLRALQGRMFKTETIKHELEIFGCKEWTNVPIEGCNKLVSTYQKLLLQNIKGKGCSTKY